MLCIGHAEVKCCCVKTALKLHKAWRGRFLQLNFEACHDYFLVQSVEYNYLIPCYKTSADVITSIHNPEAGEHRKALIPTICVQRQIILRC
jgi:hypothetical protein